MFEREFEFTVPQNVYSCVLKLHAHKDNDLYWSRGIYRYSVELITVKPNEEYQVNIQHPYLFPCVSATIREDVGGKTIFRGSASIDKANFWGSLIFSGVLITLSLFFQAWIFALLLIAVMMIGWFGILREQRKLISAIEAVVSSSQ